MPVDSFVLDKSASVTSTLPVTKAASYMEKYKTGYNFLIDRGVYRGIVARMGQAG